MPHSQNIASGAGLSKEFNFKKILDATNSIVFDLSDLNELKRLQGEYGFSDIGDLRFTMKCAEASCDCKGVGTYPCAKNWSVGLISQTKVKGVNTYNVHTRFEHKLTYAIDPDDSVKEKDFQCGTGASEACLSDGTNCTALNAEDVALKDYSRVLCHRD